TGMHHTVSEFLDFGNLRNLSNYLRFVSFLIAYKEWYSDEVIRHIPSDNGNWIQERAFSAFRTYWRNEDRQVIDILRQSPRPDDGNDDDGDDGAGVGSFDSGPNPDDERFSRRHGFSHSSSGGMFRGGGGGALIDSSPVFIPDSFPVDPHLRLVEIGKKLRELNCLYSDFYRDFTKKTDYC
ncbi:hypothetical protein K435DRAFT_781791, partial [Dendrothele bispora CBS 962.96]